MSLFRSLSGSGLTISLFQKYISWKYLEIVKSSQKKRQDGCNEDINCSTPLLNEQKNKQHESFSQNNPTLREFITLSDVVFHIAKPRYLEKRPENITNFSITVFFLLPKIEFMRSKSRFKNSFKKRLYTLNSILRDNQCFSCKFEHIKNLSRSC